MGIMDRVRALRGGAGSNPPKEVKPLHDRPANAGGEIPGHVNSGNREMGPEEATLRRKMGMAVPEGAKTPADSLRAARAEAAREVQARPAVLNADRASNDVAPRTAAVAEQLADAAVNRRIAARERSPEMATMYKDAARGHVERAASTNSTRVAQAFVGAEIARAGINRQAQPGQGEWDGDGDRQAKRSRMSQSVG